MFGKLVSVLLALVMCVAAMSLGAFASSEDAALGGELPRASFALADGVYAACYELGASSRFGASEFSVLTFDVSRGDLLFDVVRDASPVPASVEGAVIASVRGGGADEPFAVEDGAIALASGESAAFGADASGRALVGVLSASVEIRDRVSAQSVVADSVGRDGAIAVYRADDTDLDTLAADKYRAAIECASDGLLVPGVPVEGVVAATAKAGETLASGGAIIVAGDEADLSFFAPGDAVTVTADLSDTRGNTDAWRTVQNSVGGSTLLVSDGEAIAAGEEKTAASAIGVRADGKAVVVSFAHGAGMSERDLATLCAELELVDAFAVGCGGMLVLVDPTETATSEAPELPDLAARLTSPLWQMKHMKLEPAQGEVRAIPNSAPHDAASDAPSEAPAPDAQAADVDSYGPTNAAFRQIEFDSTGEWLTLVINESDVEAWYGKIY